MTFKKILCPVDFSEASYEALNKAVELAQDAAEVCVIHVEPASTELTPIAGFTPYARPESERRAEAVANLCTILEDRVPVAVHARPLLKCGDAATEIVRTAREEGIDLIVMTAHGAGTAGPGGLGNVAEAIVCAAPCSVLTVSAPATMPVNELEAQSFSEADLHGLLRPQLEIASSKAIFLDGD